MSDDKHSGNHPHDLVYKLDEKMSTEEFSAHEKCEDELSMILDCNMNCQVSWWWLLASRTDR